MVIISHIVLVQRTSLTYFLNGPRSIGTTVGVSPEYQEGLYFVAFWYQSSIGQIVVVAVTSAIVDGKIQICATMSKTEIFQHHYPTTLIITEGFSHTTQLLYNSANMCITLE